MRGGKAKEWHIYMNFWCTKAKSILFDSAEKVASTGAGVAANKTFNSLYPIAASGGFSIKKITVL